MGKDNLGNRFVGSEIPQWMKRGYIARENRRRARSDYQNNYIKKCLQRGIRPPLSKEQVRCGARRIA